MKKIVSKLVECGFSFEYENRNSNGERISVYLLDLVIDCYQGEVHWLYENESEFFQESESVFNSFLPRIEKIMIDETSSFN